MTFVLNNNATYEYNIIIKPTKSRFKVGDFVYTKPVVSFSNCHDKHKIIIEPAKLGIIINIPEDGTNIVDSETIGENYPWYINESGTIIDQPGTGSVWCFLDSERKYFVKWLNKFSYPKKEFFSNSNISLYLECLLFKAPNIVKEIKLIANKNKNEIILKILNKKLNIDFVSTNAIKNIINSFSKYHINT